MKWKVRWKVQAQGENSLLKLIKKKVVPPPKKKQQLFFIFFPKLPIRKATNPTCLPPQINLINSGHFSNKAAAAQMKVDQAKTVSSAACQVSSLCDLASSKALLPGAGPNFFHLGQAAVDKKPSLPETDRQFAPEKGTMLEGISTSNHQFSSKHVTLR